MANVPYKNTSSTDIAEHRRSFVAHFRLRGYSTRKICEAIQKLDPPCINEKTGNPWSNKVIDMDCKVLIDRWRQQSQADESKLRARQWAELQEIKRKAWETEDYPLVLRCHDREASLLGLDKKKDPSAIVDPEVQAKIQAHQALATRIASLPDDQVVSLMKELAASRSILPSSAGETVTTIEILSPASPDASDGQERDVTPTDDPDSDIDDIESPDGIIAEDGDPNDDPDGIPPLIVWHCPVSGKRLEEC